MSARKPAPVWMMAVVTDPAAPASGCAARPVLPSGAVPPLRRSGPGDAVERLLAALRSVRNPETGVDIVSEGWVGEVVIGAGEASVGLWARVPGCRALRGIAEDTFDVLRSQLPDTDLYVRELHPS